MSPTHAIAHIHTKPRVFSRKATCTKTQVMCNAPNYSGPDPSVRMQGTNTSTVVANRSERGTSPVSRLQMGNLGQARAGTVGTTNRQLAWLSNPPLGSPFHSGLASVPHAKAAISLQHFWGATYPYSPGRSPIRNSTIDKLRRCRDGVHLRPPAGSHPAFAGLPSGLAGHAIGISSTTPGVAHFLASHRFQSLDVSVPE